MFQNPFEQSKTDLNLAFCCFDPANLFCFKCLSTTSQVCICGPAHLSDLTWTGWKAGKLG